MKEYYYVGMDIHKKTIAYCTMLSDGTIVKEGRIQSNHQVLASWAKALPTPFVAGMEATMFTGWMYDEMKRKGHKVTVGHPYMLKAMAAGKNKNDKLDARMLANLLRADLFPACYMAPEELRKLRRIMRYRNLLVREATRMKNRTACLLMEVGAEYEAKRLHGKRYFNELLDSLDGVPESVLHLLGLSRSSIEFFEAQHKKLLNGLAASPLLCERVERLMTIPAVGITTALTWALEVGEPTRFSSRSRAISYCGLCSAQHESAGKNVRGPLSKQRNKHLQSILIEAAKLAPIHSPQLAAVHQEARANGASKNRATLAVARKLVAYLLCVDKSGKEFVPHDIN